MTWLTPPTADVRVPEPWCATPVTQPATSPRDAAAVRPVDGGEPLEEVDLPCHVLYDHLPLPPRIGVRLRAGVHRRLHAAAAALPAPFGLVVLDGWRSPGYQRALLEHYRAAVPGLADGWVADPALGPVPPHTTGGAVDLTLTWDGVPLSLGTDFDAFDDRARPGALEPAQAGPDLLARDLRRMLARALGAHGLTVYPMEWWHWSYGDQWWAAADGRATCPYGAVES